jgi:hypothetical protein
MQQNMCVSYYIIKKREALVMKKVFIFVVVFAANALQSMENQTPPEECITKAQLITNANDGFIISSTIEINFNFLETYISIMTHNGAVTVTSYSPLYVKLQNKINSIVDKKNDNEKTVNLKNTDVNAIYKLIKPYLNKNF